VTNFVTDFDKEVFDARWWLINCESLVVSGDKPSIQRSLMEILVDELKNILNHGIQG
jgi:hypothetical protein